MTYTYSNNTASSDPTAGKLKFDNVDFTAITKFRISLTDAGTVDRTTTIRAWDSGADPEHRGYILVQKSGLPGDFVLFEVTAARVDNSGWEEFTVAFVQKGGTIANGDSVDVFRAGASTVSGKLKFDDADPSLATVLRISNTDGDNNPLSALLALLDASTSTVRSTLVIYRDGAPGTVLVLNVTGARTDNSGWKEFPVSVVTNNGIFNTGDVVRVVFALTGDGGGGGGSTLDGRQAIFSKATQSIPNTTWTEITYGAPSGELVTDGYIDAGSTAGRLKFLLPGIYHVLFSGLGYDDSAGGTVRAISMQISPVGGPGENWTIPTQAFSPTMHDLLNDNYGVFSIEAIVRVSAADVAAEAGAPGTRDVQVTTYHDKGGAWTFNQLKLVVTRLGDMPA
jgi:hypothetical protein